MKLDLLVFAAHPDDAELACAGTILSFTSRGKNVGIIDLTAGELGTRGSAELRREEAKAAAEILGLRIRENLGLPDGFFNEDQETLLKLIQVIRRYSPDIVLVNGEYDRHPDHGNGGRLARRACFLSGLSKIVTYDNNLPQKEWRPINVYHYIQDRFIKPDFVVDISSYWEQKTEAIRAFKSQFYSSESQEPVTYISNPEFLKFIEARARELGHSIGVTYGEGFTTDMKRAVGIRNLDDLL